MRIGVVLLILVILLGTALLFCVVPPNSSWHTIRARFADVTESGYGETRPATTQAYRTARELLELESNARSIASAVGYLTPIAHKSPGHQYLDDNYYYLRTSNSAFVVRYRGRVFLISAGHVFTGKNVNEISVVYFNGAPIALPSEIAISEVLDLAAYDITTLPGRPRSAGELKTTTDDLTVETPLIAICNPRVFTVPVRTGFFRRMDITQRVAFQRSEMELEFPGVGTEAGCSGSPVIDLQGFIRGVIVRSFNGRIALATPGNIVALFLDEKFFHYASYTLRQQTDANLASSGMPYRPEKGDFP